MLDGIEELKKSPKRIEELIQGKHYLAAVRTLLQSLKTIQGSDYASVEALVDVQGILLLMRNSLHETILDDLHRYLYMKSPYCDENLFGDLEVVLQTSPLQHSLHQSPITASPSHRSSFLAAEGAGGAGGSMKPSKTNVSPSSMRKHRRFRSDVVAALAQRTKSDSMARTALEESPMGGDVEEILAEDLEANPEEDPLKHIEIMVAALDLLGRLDDGVNAIKQRLPLELYKVTQKMVVEMRDRWSDAILSVSAERHNNHDSRVRLLPNIHPMTPYVLKDLLNSLGKKMLWIMHMHRHTILTFNRATSRSDDSNGGGGGNHDMRVGSVVSHRACVLVGKEREKRPIRYSLADLWSSVQNEIRSLLSAYVTETSRTLPAMVVNVDLASKDPSMDQRMVGASCSRISNDMTMILVALQIC